jgi:hypothetical protein
MVGEVKVCVHERVQMSQSQRERGCPRQAIGVLAYGCEELGGGDGRYVRGAVRWDR